MDIASQQRIKALCSQPYSAEEGLDEFTSKSLVPLLGIDVWEHVYYRQYKNVRPDYVKAIWNAINLENVSERIQSANSVCQLGERERTWRM